MSNRLGMDADAVEAIAHQMQATSRQLDGVIRSIDATVNHALNAWHGPDTAQFHQDWMTNRRSPLMGATTGIDEFVKVLLKNVQDQRETSNNYPQWDSLVQGVQHVVDDVKRAGEHMVRDFFIGDGTQRSPSIAAEVGKEGHQKADRDMMELAFDAYQQPPKGYASFREVTGAELSELGISEKDLHQSVSGMDANLYKDGDGNYVLSFRGTTDLNDWANDGAQGAGGISLQNYDAGNLAAKLHRKIGDRLVFTGHSLGGQLAAYSAMQTGSSAVTFDAAGTQDVWKVWATSHDSPSGHIRNYHTAGDPLTAAERMTAPVMVAPGAWIDLVPGASGEQIELQAAAKNPDANWWDIGKNFDNVIDQHSGEAMRDGYRRAFGDD